MDGDDVMIPTERVPMPVYSEADTNTATPATTDEGQQPNTTTTVNKTSTREHVENQQPTQPPSQGVVMDASVDEAAMNALKRYKKRILTPFNIILKTVGLRAFFSAGGSGRCHGGCFAKCTKYAQPLIVFILLLVATVAQLASCFFRYRSIPIKSNGVIQCEDRLVTYAIIPYLVVLVSYVLSVYAFRVAEPDQLYPLATASFGSFKGVTSTKSRKRPYHILAIVFALGMLYLVLSVGTSVVRMLALKLESSTTVIAWFTTNPSSPTPLSSLKLNPVFVYAIVHYILLVIDMIGFVLFDVLFVAIVVNYASQCVLLTLYIENVEDKVRNKKYCNLYDAADDIQKIQEHLKKFNGKIAPVTSLYYFIFMVYLVLSYTELSMGMDYPVLNEAAGFMNTVQWLIAVVSTPIMAVRLTVAGNGLKRLGHEVATGQSRYYKARIHYMNVDLYHWGQGSYDGNRRERGYNDNWQLVKDVIERCDDIHKDLEMQFFQQFTESTRYNAKLLFMPMQPGLAIGLALLFMLLFCTGIIIPHVQSVNWF